MTIFRFLIVPMSLYLMWDKRQALAGAPVGPSWIGVALLVVAVLLWTIGTLVQVRVCGVRLWTRSFPTGGEGPCTNDSMTFASALSI